MTRMTKILFVLVSLSAAFAVALAVRTAPTSPRKIELTPEEVTALTPVAPKPAHHEPVPAPPAEDDAGGTAGIPEDGQGS